MKLYLIHCGFYDTELCDGIYESHVNFFIAAETFEDAKAKMKISPDFQKKRMHIDGLQEISVVNGWKVNLTEDKTAEGRTILLNNKHRDLALKTT